MRTLFAKIFLWFLLTIFVSFAVAFTVSSVMFGSRPPTFRGFSYPMHDAREGWEREGRAGLQRFVNRFHEIDGADAVLTDSAGHDLLTGKDYSQYLKGPARSVVPFLRQRRGFLIPSRAKDGKYWFLVMLPWRQQQSQAWWNVEVPPQTWWMLAVAALLCYGLARHLTSPLRRMQKTIERFGHGDFSARVNSRRRDELGQLARTSDRMAERIELLLKAQRRLLQDISHELRSPLARLGVAVELARGGADMNSALNRIEKEADRLNTLVGELIQVTRAEGDPAGLVTENVQLDELIGSIVEDARIEADRRAIDLHTQLVPCEISGNPELLRRAIENVVRNAIRYSPESSTVDIGLARLETAYQISIRDYGPGVPEEALGSIFDPFYRVESDRGRSSGGVGLGLAIARRALELHHGFVRAVNAHPGLKVEMELPALTRADSPAYQIAGAPAKT